MTRDEGHLLDLEYVIAALQKVAGVSRSGDLVYIRSTNEEFLKLASQAVASLNTASSLQWKCYFVSQEVTSPMHITADYAVELRELKADPLLLVVDVRRAGSGLDGIYSSGREIDETAILDLVLDQSMAAKDRELLKCIREIQSAAKRLGKTRDIFAEIHHAVLAESMRDALELCWLLGLWPVADCPSVERANLLEVSVQLIRELIPQANSRYELPRSRLDRLDIDPRDERLNPVVNLIERSSRMSYQEAYETEPLPPELYVGNWKVGLRVARELQKIELMSWRNSKGEAHVWSGLQIGDNGQLEFVVDANSDKGGDLVIRWKTTPKIIPRNDLTFSVAVVAGGSEVLVQRDVTSTGKDILSAKFRSDEFDIEPRDYYEAQILVSAGDTTAVTEDFVVREGVATPKKSTAAQTYRSVAEFLGRVGDEDLFRKSCNEPGAVAEVRGSQVELRAFNGQRVHRGRMAVPGLWAKAETLFLEHQEQLGFLEAKVNVNGKLDMDSLTFRSIKVDENPQASELLRTWLRVCKRVDGASSFLCLNLSNNDAESDDFVRLWNQLAPGNWRELGLLNTLKLLRTDGTLLGLILLPLHPIRLAFRIYFDSFVQWAAFESAEKMSAKELESLLSAVSGNVLPALYPLPMGDGSTRILQASGSLDLSAQLMLPNDSPDPVLDERLLRRIWHDNLNEYLARPDLEEWRTQQLAAELASLSGPSSANTIIVNNFSGGDGSQLAAALTTARNVIEMWTKENRQESDEGGGRERLPRFFVRHFPSLDTPREYFDQLALFFSDLWTLGQAARDAVPESYRWIFEEIYGESRFNNGYPLIWAKRESATPGELDTAHVSVFFDLGVCEIGFAEQSSLSKLDATNPLFGLAPSWVHEFHSNKDQLSWVDYTTRPGKHDRFTRRQPDRRLEDALEVARVAVVHVIGGNPADDWPVVWRRLKPEHLKLLTAAHECSEKVVLLTSHALDVYRSGISEFAPASVLASELPGNELAGGSGGVSAVRLTSLFTKGYLQRVTPLAGDDLDDDNLLLTLGKLGQVSLHRAIQFTDRNEYAPLAYAVGRFAAAYSSGQFGDCLPARDQSLVISLGDLPSEFRGERENSLSVVPVDANFEDLLVISARSNRTTLGLNFVRVLLRHDHFQKTAAEDFADLIRRRESVWKSILNTGGEVLAHLAPRLALASVIERAIEGEQGGLLRDGIRQNFERRLDALRSIDASQVTFDLGAPDARHLQCMVTEINEIDFNDGSPIVSVRHLNITEIKHPGSRTHIETSFPDIAVGNRSEIGVENIEPDLDAGHPEKIESVAKLTNEDPAYTCISVTNIEETAGYRSDSEIEEALEPKIAGEKKIEGYNDTHSSSGESRINSLPSVVLGESNLGRRALWEPRTTSNPHLLLTGQSGMGKTTALINAAMGLWDSGVVPVVISFHPDIDDAVERAWGRELQVSTLHNARFNPLQLSADEAKGNPYAHIDTSFMVRDLFAAIFPSLGDLQLGQVRDAVQKTYEEFGWGGSGAIKEIPSLLDVHANLKRRKDADRNLMLRLDEVFVYRGLFQGGEERSYLQSEAPVLLKLSGSKLETLQNAAVIFALQSMFSEMFRRGIRQSISHVIVIDEAHRLSGLKLLTEFAREARKYGIALLLASQRIADFPDDLLSNIGSLLFFRANEDDAKIAGKYLGNASDARNWADRVKGLAPHTAIFKSGADSAVTVDASPPRTDERQVPLVGD